MKFITLRAITLSLLLHICAGILLFLSLDVSVEPVQQITPREKVMEAVAVDHTQIAAELDRLKEIEEQKQREQLRMQQELENKLREAERKTVTIEKKRREEEQRLADIRKQQQQEEQKRKEEEKKLAEMKKNQQELEKQRQLAEQKRKDEELKKAEAEKKRKEEEQRRKAAEAALKQQLAEEQKQLEAAQAREDQGVINQNVARIADAISREFNTAGLQPGLSCVFQIRMIPGGEVVDARIVKSSGDPVFDSRAEIALKKASPLPVPENPRIFDKMREIRLTFAPR